MLVTRFKFKRSTDKGRFSWSAESDSERSGIAPGFYAAGKTLTDVKEFAALVRWCERTNLLERLSERYPDGWRGRVQAAWIVPRRVSLRHRTTLARGR